MSPEMPNAASPTTEVSTKSPWARIVGVFLSPREVFEDINRKPDWLVPLIVMVLISLATTYAFFSHADMIQLISDQIEKSGRPVPPPEALQSAAKFGVIWGYVAVILFTPIGLLLVAGVLFVVFSFFLGADTTFPKVFSANLYASMISLLKSIIAIPILFVKTPSEFGNPADVVQSNLTLLMPSDHKALQALGKSLDIFILWYVLVIAFGVVGVSKNLTFKKALTTLIILWVLVTGVFVAIAAIRK